MADNAARSFVESIDWRGFLEGAVLLVIDCHTLDVHWLGQGRTDLASVLGLPTATWAATGSGFTQPIFKAPRLHSEAAGGMVEGFKPTIDKNQLREGERLVLSGRLTDVNAEAVGQAVIALVGTHETTLSDADGRVLFLITIPPGEALELQVSTPSGGVLHKVVNLRGSAHLLTPNDSLGANSFYEGQRVWRSSFSLSMTA